jgi:hypothetical protein
MIDMAERELPELDADWVNRKSEQNFNIGFIQNLQSNLQISEVIEWLNFVWPCSAGFRSSHIRCEPFET